MRTIIALGSIMAILSPAALLAGEPDGLACKVERTGPYGTIVAERDLLVSGIQNRMEVNWKPPLPPYGRPSLGGYWGRAGTGELERGDGYLHVHWALPKGNFDRSLRLDMWRGVGSPDPRLVFLGRYRRVGGLGFFEMVDFSNLPTAPEPLTLVLRDESGSIVDQAIVEPAALQTVFDEVDAAIGETAKMASESRCDPYVEILTI